MCVWWRRGGEERGGVREREREREREKERERERERERETCAQAAA